jgi:hypothetical protein
LRRRGRMVGNEKPADPITLFTETIVKLIQEVNKLSEQQQKIYDLLSKRSKEAFNEKEITTTKIIDLQPGEPHPVSPAANSQGPQEFFEQDLKNCEVVELKPNSFHIVKNDLYMYLAYSLVVSPKKEEVVKFHRYDFVLTDKAAHWVPKKWKKGGVF